MGGEPARGGEPAKIWVFWGLFGLFGRSGQNVRFDFSGENFYGRPSDSFRVTSD